MKVTIEPTSVTNYNRDLAQLQTFFLFCLIVAGKNSDWAARCVSRLLDNCPHNRLPIDWLNDNDCVDLHNILVANKIGQYHRICQAIQEAKNVPLDTCTLEELENIYGVGPKTARFFLLHSRPGVICIPLDTHILKWLDEHGVDNVPQNTPTSIKEYKRLESMAIYLIANTYTGLSLAQADLLIWSKVSGRLRL